MPATVLGQAGGFERRFRMTSNVGPLVMVERYLVLGQRAFVLATQEYAVSIIDAATLGPAPPDGIFAARLELPYGTDWSPADQIVIRRRGTPYSVLAEHTRAATTSPPETLLDQKIAALVPKLPGAAVIGRVASTVVEGLQGEIATLRWQQRGSPMLTKLGVAIAGADVFAVTISLPHNEQNQFASLARQVRLNPLVLAER